MGPQLHGELGGQGRALRTQFSASASPQNWSLLKLHCSIISFHPSGAAIAGFVTFEDTAQALAVSERSRLTGIQYIALGGLKCHAGTFSDVP